MCKNNFSRRELELIEDIQSAESYVSGDNDLEVNYHDGAWWAYEYNGDESRIINNYSNEPLIVDKEIEKYNVDIYGVFNHCNVYYCG